MSISRVQFAKNDSGTGTTGFSIASGQGWSSSGSGHLIVVVLFIFSSINSGGTVTDNQSNTYNVDFRSGANSDGAIKVFSLPNCPSGITSFTISGTGSASSGVAIEYSGIATSSPLDVAVSAMNNQNSVSSWNSNSITTTGSSDLLIGAVQDPHIGSSDNFAASGSWSGVTQANNTGDGDSAFVEDQLNVSANTYDATGTAAAGSDAGSMIISYKGAALGLIARMKTRARQTWKRAASQYRKLVRISNWHTGATPPIPSVLVVKSFARPRRKTATSFQWKKTAHFFPLQHTGKTFTVGKFLTRVRKRRPLAAYQFRKQARFYQWHTGFFPPPPTTGENWISLHGAYRMRRPVVFLR